MGLKGTLGGMAAAMFAPKSALTFAIEAERTITTGRMLGLTREQMDECIKRETLHARHTPDPFRWDVVRRDMISMAATPTEPHAP